MEAHGGTQDTRTHEIVVDLLDNHGDDDGDNSFFVKDDGGYGDWSIGYASSTDGLSWAKYPDPLLVGTEPWEGDNVYFPEVVANDGGYAMWYSALVEGPTVAGIGYAVSPDGIHWVKWGDNPVLESIPPCNAADSFAVIREGGTVHGWFTHCYDVYHVTSPNEFVFFDGLESVEMHNNLIVRQGSDAGRIQPAAGHPRYAARRRAGGIRR